MRSSHLEAGGHRLETWSEGPDGSQGPTLVFLHEGLGSVEQWRDFPQKLAQATGLGAFAYSRAGYGRSSSIQLPRPVRYMHDEARLLPQILSAAGIAKPILVGHSDGASIAILAAGSGAPALALVLEAPHVFAEEAGLASIARARDAYAKTDLRARLARYHDDVDAAFLGWNGAWLDPAFKEWNIEASLPAIHAPVLIIQGEDDEYGTQKQLEAIQRGAGGPVTIELLPRCGHAPHRERPQETLAAMTRFIQSLS